MNTAESLLREALDMLSDRPNYGLRHDPAATSYKLAARIGEFLMQPMRVEVSAVRAETGGRNFATCNDDPAMACRFGVYIRNPLAFHVEDFVAHEQPAAPGAEDRQASQRAAAKAAAFAYADALAEHLGCAVVSQLSREG